MIVIQMKVAALAFSEERKVRKRNQNNLSYKDETNITTSFTKYLKSGCLHFNILKFHFKN
jgi:hypothetical protein